MEIQGDGVVSLPDAETWLRAVQVDTSDVHSVGKEEVGSRTWSVYQRGKASERVLVWCCQMCACLSAHATMDA